MQIVLPSIRPSAHDQTRPLCFLSTDYGQTRIPLRCSPRGSIAFDGAPEEGHLDASAALLQEHDHHRSARHARMWTPYPLAVIGSVCTTIPISRPFATSGEFTTHIYCHRELSQRCISHSKLHPHHLHHNARRHLNCPRSFRHEYVSQRRAFSPQVAL